MNTLTLATIVFIVTMSQVGCTLVKSPVKVTHKYEPKMKFIKGGYLLINKKKPANLKNNKVKIKSFWIAKTEVTYQQWKNCFKNGGCKKDKVYDSKSRSDYHFPVAYVSWYEANEYTRWLSKISGKKYRLPTEAEWLLAARAGKKTRFPWGDKLTEIEKCTGCNMISGGGTAPVGSLKPYGGLYDMYGNVSEWTCSLSTDASKSPLSNENKCLTPATYSSGYIITKGGSHENTFDNEAYMGDPDASLDAAFIPADQLGWVGFRVIREMQ